MAFESLELHHPVQAQLKSRRLRYREPENLIKWPYEKLLREQSKTRRVYPINPYAEVYQFRKNVYAIFTESLDGAGNPWIYLILGREKAMLIDTGFGAGDLKGLVNEITGGMPLIVVNTHAHSDHALGDFQFDEVYCHEYEVLNLEKIETPHAWDRLFDAEGNCIYTQFDRADLIGYHDFKIIGVPNGTTFDLGGGTEIELMFLPGHATGMSAFLDKQNKILFAGDYTHAYGTSPDHPYARYCTVTAMRDALMNIIARRSEIDFVYPGHGPLDQPSIVLVNLLETLEQVLENPEHSDFQEEMIKGGKKKVIYGKMIFQSSYFKYCMESLR